MARTGFSKVSVDDLLDEEEENELLLKRASKKYKAAEAAYTDSERQKEELLRLFEEAEQEIKPCLHNGLTGLGQNHLQMVLKGRLHQAALIAQMPEHPRRWPQVRTFSEEVLQFDSANCHAHYLRSLALKFGDHLDSLAGDAMRKAKEYASMQGKTAELSKWTSVMDPSKPAEDLEDVEAEGEGDETAVEVVEEAEALEELEEERVEEQQQQQQGAKVPSAPALQKGFLNRSKKKVSTSESLQPQQPQTSAAPARPASQPEGRSEQESGRRQKQEEEAEAISETLRALREELKEKESQLRDGEEALRQARQETSNAKERLEQWKSDLAGELDTLGKDFEQMALRPGEQESPEEVVESIRKAAAAIDDQLSVSRKWCEDEQQRVMDFATEVATVREMAARELREKQDTSRQQVSEVKELVTRVGQLKTSAKALRDQVKKRADQAESDVQDFADKVLEFRALPAWTKLAAFLDDVIVLRLLLLTLILGAILALGMVTEGFGPGRCRLVCGPRI